MKCYSYDGQLAGDVSGATTVSMTMIAIDFFPIRIGTSSRKNRENKTFKLSLVAKLSIT